MINHGTNAKEELTKMLMESYDRGVADTQAAAFAALGAMERAIATAVEAERDRIIKSNALAEPEQEPVCDKDPQGCWAVRCQLAKVCKNALPLHKKWQGLKKDEILSLYGKDLSYRDGDYERYARAIEDALKKKNT